MAAKRIYRDDMQCPRCGSNWLPKYGHARGKQTYRCGQCGYHFTPAAKHPHHAPETRRLAEAMYVEGLGISAIGRVLGVNLETAYSWVKKSLLGWGFVASVGGVAWRGRRERGRSHAKVISFDEMWSYVGARHRRKRREVWIWTAVVAEADGRRWVDFEVGDPSETTFLKLYGRLPAAERYVSDGYRVYEWLPRNRHEVGKGMEANRNEGLHSRLRDKLNRLARRTKGYTKSVPMLRDSIALVCLRLGLI